MAQDPKTKESKAEAEKGRFVIISTTHGKPYRRAGMRFTPEGVRLAVEDLTEDQIKQIEADKLLKVVAEKD